MAANDFDVVLLGFLQGTFDHLVGYGVRKQYEQIRSAHLLFQVACHLGEYLCLTFMRLADVMVLAHHPVVSPDYHYTHTHALSFLL